MRSPLIPVFLLLGWVAGCAGQSSIKPVQDLDERTGVTLGSLKEPIELLPNAQVAAAVTQKRVTFAYLGPVEWNRSGDLSYGLWIHIVPGPGPQPGDIHAAGALTLILDDGPLVLSIIDPPKLGRAPYQPAASWGQTAYFGLTVGMLKAMAASRKLELDVHAADGSTLSFSPPQDTRPTFTQYLQARGLTGD
jgi:hypothetical protein